MPNSSSIIKKIEVTKDVNTTIVVNDIIKYITQQLNVVNIATDNGTNTYLDMQTDTFSVNQIVCKSDIIIGNKSNIYKLIKYIIMCNPDCQIRLTKIVNNENLDILKLTFLIDLVNENIKYSSSMARKYNAMPKHNIVDLLKHILKSYGLKHNVTTYICTSSIKLYFPICCLKYNNNQYGVLSNKHILNHSI